MASTFDQTYESGSADHTKPTGGRCCIRFSARAQVNVTENRGRCLAQQSASDHEGAALMRRSTRARMARGFNPPIAKSRRVPSAPTK